MKKSNDDLTIQYGAKELKKFIEKSTVWAINIAISIFASVFLLSSALNLFDKGVDVVIDVFDADTIPLIDYDKIKVKDRKPKVIEQELPKGLPGSQKNAKIGSDKVAGKIKSVKDTEGKKFDDFAPVDKIAISTPEVSNKPIKTGILLPPIFTGNGNGKKEIEIPEMDDYITYDEEPNVDYQHLLSILVYPEMARMANVEGQVLLKVLIDPSGKVKKVHVMESGNSLLEKASIEAIKKARFTPAVQNGQKVHSWIAVPINFVLRHK